MTQMSTRVAPVLPKSERRCRHCDLPLTGAQQERGEAFCCPGCDRVHGLLHDAGLERYYTLRRGPGAPPAEVPTAEFAWLDARLSGEPASPLVLDLEIQGIHCAGCVWVLQELFRRHAGGLDLRINSALGRAHVVWDVHRSDVRQWLREAEAFGYRLGPVYADRPPASRDLLLRLGISSAIAAHVMTFSLCFYLGLTSAGGSLFALFGALGFVLTAISVLVGGWVFFRGAWLGIRRGLLHLDLPIALGIGLAFGGSTVAYLRGGPEAAYFDTVAVFVALMLVGRWAQERVLERNRYRLLTDGGVDGMFVRRYHRGHLESIPVTGVEARQELWIVPGEVVPVRGTAIDPASIRLDWMTGESDVHGIEPGGELPAGAINAGSARVRMVSAEPFADSALRGLLVPPDSRAGAGRRSAARWWHRLAAGYVATVLLLAAAGFLLWLDAGPARALQVTVSLLVVACPCAVGLAVPLAYDLMHMRLRRAGVFVREGDLLDRGLAVRRVVFDKTGTLTGRPTLTPESESSLRTLDPESRNALFTLVSQSNHPVSRAILAVLERTGESGPVTGRDPVEDLAGRGVRLRNGHDYRLGRDTFAAAPGSAPGSEAEGAVFSVEGRSLASFAIEESLRDDAVEEVAGLRELGLEVVLLSGDRAARVEQAAHLLGLEPGAAVAGATPAEKAAWIARYDRDDTLMVGDGINDAPALAAAHCAGTPAVDHPSVSARTDFYYLGSGIAAVRRVLLASRRLRAVVRSSLILAVGYNALAVTAALAGWITPLVAAVLMPVSSIGVVTLTAVRLSRKEDSWTSSS